MRLAESQQAEDVFNVERGAFQRRTLRRGRLGRSPAAEARGA